MGRVLYVNLDFPPLSGPGIWRAVGFVKYLPEHGFQCTVLCSDRSPSRDRYDRSLLADLPRDTEVHRIASKFQADVVAPLERIRQAIPSQALARRFGRVQSRIIREYPDQQIHWAMKVAARGAMLVARRKFDCMITSGPPHVAHLAGLLIRRARNVPWIMDYRDLWTDDEVQIKKGSYQRAFFERVERAAVKAADAVVCVSPGYREHLSARFASVKPSDRFFMILNGHDLEPELVERSLARPKNARLHLHFNGTPQVTHPFGKIVDALDRIRAVHGEAALPEVTFTGFPPKLTEQIAALRLERHVVDVGHMSRIASIEYSMRCDALIAMVNAKNPLYRGTIPGKTYEAMALGRHLLAILPRGTVVGALIDDCGNGTLCDVDDLSDIIRGIEKIMALHREGRLNADVTPEHQRRIAEKYSRRAETRELVEVIRAVQR